MIDLVGCSYTSIWSWMRAGTFPRSVAVGATSRWRASEVAAWLKSRPVVRLKGDGPLREV